MTSAMNCRKMVSRVRQRIHDVGSRVYDDAEILSTADDVMREMFTQMRSAGQNWGIDRMDVALGAFAQPETNVFELELGEQVTDIQLVEAVSSAGGVPPRPIPHVELELKDAGARSPFPSYPVWFYSRYGHAGAIQIRGQWATTVPTIRLWFIRSWGPMCFGTASAGSTTSITPGVVTGDYNNRSGVFQNMELEITADSGGAANVGQIRRISLFSGGVFTVPALPAAASATTQWAIVLPIPPEAVNIVLGRVAVTLLARGGSPEEYALQEDRLKKDELVWSQNLTQRQTGEPRRIYSSRMHR